LGTVIVLCAISAVRMIKFSDSIDPDAGSVWEKSMEYPDQFVEFVLLKFAPGMLPADGSGGVASAGGSEPSGGGAYAPVYPQSRQSQSQADSSAKTDDVSKRPDMPGMPNMPGVSDMSAGRGDVTPPSPGIPAGTGEWGMTIDSSTSVYSLKGKLMGHLPAGKIFSVVRYKSSPKGDLLICTVGRSTKQIIIRRKDAILYKCDVSDTTPEQRRLCTEQAKLLGAISSRKAQLKKAARGSNPYAAEYKSALREYKSFAKKNNALLEEYNSSSGPRRMEVADELRLIKEKSARITEEFGAIKTKYKGWKAGHQVKTPDYKHDPQIKRLQQKLVAVENKLANP